MLKIIKIILSIIFIFLITATAWFTFLEFQHSQTLDESLVSDLTTQLDIVQINKAVGKITPEAK